MLPKDGLGASDHDANLPDKAIINCFGDLR
jgi:hypothetical protein